MEYGYPSKTRSSGGIQSRTLTHSLFEGWFWRGNGEIGLGKNSGREILEKTPEDWNIWKKHPGRLTWNLKVVVSFRWFSFSIESIFRFHVNCQGCKRFFSSTFPVTPKMKNTVSPICDGGWFGEVPFLKAQVSKMTFSKGTNAIGFWRWSILLVMVRSKSG